ncbi:MAG TPA: IS5 family transposase [Candidatus Nanopelagicaceae bacterium]|nr:IS5 family transposase [Candidatus Nanopelagicaceae bacterium]
MRGTTSRQVTMLGWIDPEELIPVNHPIRRVKLLAEAALRELEPTFAGMYAQIGRPSIPPEQLLNSCLLMALYTIRSERQFCERLRYDLLFKWFLNLNVEDEPFDHSSFAKNRKRLLEHRVSRLFFEAVVKQARKRQLLSSQHFTVDGTLLESWASMKSLRPRSDDDQPGGSNGYTPSNPDVDFKGQRRSNETHFSPTDKEALMARKGKGKETRLCFCGHVLMENRHGLAVDVEFTRATGTSEREAALVMLRRMRQRVRRHRCTLGADKTSHRDNLSRRNRGAYCGEYSCGLLDWSRPGQSFVVLDSLGEAGMQDSHQSVSHGSHRLTMRLLPGAQGVVVGATSR